MPLTAESAARKDKTNARGATFEHRHFAALADMLARLHSVNGEKNRTWVCEYFANELANTNPRFDRARFLAACNAADRS